MSNNELTASAELSELPKILDWVRKQIDLTSLSEKKRKQVELALEEAVVNVMHHASAEELILKVSYEVDQQITFDLIDVGAEFNPLVHPESSMDSPIEERKAGGLGLTFMRKCMDALFYRREEGQNILTLIKNMER